MPGPTKDPVHLSMASLSSLATPPTSSPTHASTGNQKGASAHPTDRQPFHHQHAPLLTPKNQHQEASVLLKISFAQNAINGKLKGNSKEYIQLLNDLSSLEKKSTTYACEWLQALSAIVSSLTRHVHTIVDTILGIEWSVKDDEYVALYQHFLENLVSAQSFYIVPILGMLVRHLRYDVALSISNTSPLTDEEHTRPVVTMASITARTHFVLQRILHLVPTAPSCLLPIITENFPYKTTAVQRHLWYLRNVLTILSYAPVLRNQMLGIIVEKILQLDMDLQDEDVEIDEYDSLEQTLEAIESKGIEELRKLEETIAMMGQGNNTVLRDDDMESDGSDNDEDDDDFDDEIAPELTKVDYFSHTAKIDGMLTLVFEYFSTFALTAESSKTSSRLFTTSTKDLSVQKKEEQLVDLFHHMLSIFESSILRTHQSRYTQFLVFYLCSFHPQFPDLFLGLLASKAFDTSSPPVIRSQAALYMASFVARANYLDINSVKTCLQLLVGWSVSYLDQVIRTSQQQAGHAYRHNHHHLHHHHQSHLHSALKPDLKKYGVFYAVVQAVLYVFLHRWRELMDDNEQEDENEFGEGQDVAQQSKAGFNSPVLNRLPKEMDGFQRVLTCRLDPLKICSQNVVQEFAQLSHHLNIFYVFNFLSPPTSRSSTPVPLGSTANASSNNFSVMQGQDSHQHRKQDLMFLKLETLESFFPFDPFELKGSSRFVDHLYREYEPFLSDSEEEDDEDDDGEGSTGSDEGSKSESASSGSRVPDSHSEGAQEDDDDDDDSMMEEDDDDEERRVQMELLRHTATFRK